MSHTIDAARVTKLAGKIRAITSEVTGRYIGRQDVVLATLLAILSGKMGFLLGDPGVSKTDTISAVMKRVIDAKFYGALMPSLPSAQALLVQGTTILERVLPDGGKEIEMRDTPGKAAGADVVFLDELFKADKSVLHGALDLCNGDLRVDGQEITPPMGQMAASNEIPDSTGELAALWSRMAIRVFVKPLSWDQKMSMVEATLQRPSGGIAAHTTITLAEVKELREMRPFVEVPFAIRQIVREICEKKLVEAHSDGSFDFILKDDRRFKRLFDVLQTHALLAGRIEVSKADLTVLRWMLWDTPEQIPTVEAVITPYVRTPGSEARELIDALLATGGNVHAAFTGNDASKAVAALRQCGELSRNELPRLKGQAGGTPDETQIQRWIDALTAFTAKLSGKIAGADVGNWPDAIGDLS